MKVIEKKSFSRIYKLIIIIALIAVFCGAIYWLISPLLSNNKQSVVKSKEIKKPITDNKPEPVVKPTAPAAAPVIEPDYIIPAITGGLAPVVYTLPTAQNVVFLGIDDGAFKDQSVIDIMKKNNIKASLFLYKNLISSNPDFFKQLVDQGSVVENHTISHDTNMTNTQSYDQQKAEICGMSDYVELNYGRRPTLFRPPGGAYSETMQKAVADCGMKAIATWVAKANGGSMQYQVGDKLRAGDIVLMHFRPEFAQDMAAFVSAMNAAGLHTALLEDAI